MSGEIYIRSGQAARELCITQYQLRRLAEAGVIEAEITTSGHWRIPLSEVERLKKNGVPPMPATLGSDREEPKAPTPARTGLLAAPSADVVLAAEDVAVTESRLKKRKLERELEQEEDFFRDRKTKEATARALEQARAQADAEERRRQSWQDEWQAYALDQLPCDAPSEIRLDLHQAADAVLSQMQPSQPEAIVRRVIDAAIERALKPWKQKQRAQKEIEDAAGSIPYEARGTSWSPSEWDLRAKEAARAAIQKLDEDATPTEMRTAATGAVRPIIKQFEYACRIDHQIEWLSLPGATEEEEAGAKTAAREAMQALPVGSTDRELERAKTAALEPFRIAIKTRQDRKKDYEQREQLISDASFRLALAGVFDEAKESALDRIRQALADMPEGTSATELAKICDHIVKRFAMIETGLSEIAPYLIHLEKTWEFNQTTAALEEEFKSIVREDLDGKITGKETPEQVKGIVRRFIRDDLLPPRGNH